MKTLTRNRGKASAALALTASLVLAGCSGSDDPDKVGADKADEQAEEVAIEYQAPENFVGQTSLDHGVELIANAAAEENALLAPTLNLQVVESGVTDAIPAAVFEEISGTNPGLNEDEEPIEVVHAADGHKFYIAKFTNTNPEWEVGGKDPDIEVTLHIGSDEKSSVFRTSNGTQQQGTFIMSLPEAADAEAATLRHTTQEKTQVLSLVTGERISSDVEYIYESVTKSIEMTEGASISESFPAWAGGDDHLQGEFVGAHLTTFLQPRGGGAGWAGKDKHYAVIELDWKPVSVTSFDESTIHVELENGDILYPARSILKLSDGGIAFEIPVDTETFKVVIETDIKVGGGGNAPRHSWDPLVAEFQIS